MTVLREQHLLDAAVQNGLLQAEQLERLRLRARKEHHPLLQLLHFECRLPPTLLYRNYAEFHQYDYQDKNIQPDMSLLRKLGIERAQQYHLIPLQGAQGSTPMLCANPDDRGVQQVLRRYVTGQPHLLICEPETIERTLSKFAAVVNPYELENTSLSDFDPIETLNDLLNQAFMRRASDVHFEPTADSLRVRYRVDGRLQEDSRFFSIPHGAALLSRIKVLADLDIAESRVPHDGSMEHNTPLDHSIDIRVATLPTQYGERATLRLLGGDRQLLDLQQIGMADEHLQLFRKTIAHPHGIILITGPTGSGKSTTLYAALNELADDEINILSAEDPVEMSINGISQVQVSSKTSFAGALRSFLRHDPDVIMVGEIRDRETAEIAMKAALTGHLVFSTLHTNSALESIPRLTDIGVEPYLVASTLLCVIAQRLVRRLCPHCRQPLALSESQCQALSVTVDTHIYQPKGCAHCSGVGYVGRLPLFETLWVNEALADAIAERQSQAQLRTLADSFISLAEDGRNKLLDGLTSIRELQRIGLWQQLGEQSA